MPTAYRNIELCTRISQLKYTHDKHTWQSPPATGFKTQLHIWNHTQMLINVPHAVAHLLSAKLTNLRKHKAQKIHLNIRIVVWIMDILADSRFIKLHTKLSPYSFSTSTTCSYKRFIFYFFIQNHFLKHKALAHNSKRSLWTSCSTVCTFLLFWHLYTTSFSLQSPVP